MRNQTFKKSIIKLAFKNTGLIPYNPEVVLWKVHILPRSTRTITLPSPNLTNKMTLVCTTISYRPHKIKNQAHTLINSIKRDQQLVYPKYQPYFDRFICSSVSTSLWYSIAKCNLEIIHCEAIAWSTCKKLTKRVAQKGRVITGRDVCAKITKIAETEVEKARRALEQGETAELKKENTKIATYKKLWKQLYKKLKAYLKIWPALANLLKWYDWVICRCSQKNRFYGLWAVADFEPSGIHHHLWWWPEQLQPFFLKFRTAWLPSAMLG